MKESAIGALAYDMLGGVDLTPAEGIWTGTKRGWMGEDEVRTQDFLPDDMPPLARGLLGFAGDVATDPLTWFAPQLVKGTGSLIKTVTPGIQDFLDIQVAAFGYRAIDLLKEPSVLALI